MERKIFPGYVLVKMIMTDDSCMSCATSAASLDLSARVPNLSRYEEEVERLGVDTRQVEVNFAEEIRSRWVDGYLSGFYRNGGCTGS